MNALNTNWTRLKRSDYSVIRNENGILKAILIDLADNFLASPVHRSSCLQSIAFECVLS